MRLKTKLFFSIGALFIIVALASYYFPRHFIERDAGHVQSIFTKEIETQNERAREVWQKLFDEKLDQSIITINSVLEHIVSSDAIKKGLQNQDEPIFWSTLTQIMENNPGIAFAEVTTGDKTASIVLSNAIFYETDVNASNQAVLKDQAKGLGPYKVYENYLYSLDATPSKLDEAPIIPQLPPTYEVSRRLQVLRDYVARFLKAIKTSPFDSKAPLGSMSSGIALLSKDIFFQKPLYDVLEYYNKYKPEADEAIATGVTLIDTPILSKYYIANAAKLSDSVYLTLGQTFFSDIQSVSSVADTLILFLDENGQFIHAISNSKDTVEESFFKGVPFASILNKMKGSLTIQNAPYNYFQLTSPIPVHARAFVLIPESSEPLYRLENEVNDSITQIYEKLSYQLFVAALVVLGLALLLLGYISKKITKPITELALVTKKVARGEYSDIHLPEVKNSEDEISLLTNGFSEMISGLQDREKIRNLLDKVVSKEIATEILKGNVVLGGESKIVTILFADIRGFTSMTEAIDPQVVITHLNTYMTNMTQIIEREGGVIDKYIGDEIMALYGAPVEMKDGAARAIKTALSMVDALHKWNQKKGGRPIEVGIGIHTGRVVAGNMGAETRLNYTVIGSTVNLAARLCSAAAPMEIRISQETLQSSGLEGQLKVKPLEPITYKGFSIPLPTYAVLGEQTN